MFYFTLGYNSNDLELCNLFIIRITNLHYVNSKLLILRE